ncbi:tRNA (cytosine-5-)-methyltransferase ncl1 [Vermiconidia calcicola]|uniref:tRNA (Cytosine-5-)-methyltransferase ncl1 n=1 Tax=Vermiconidia calcicola TaxID=1690605 RepID=A0ACC3MGH1_9PEZI|nr:tRNA (cytosine-5-)-methyltransferase ncl1 [Vermiconidia calcicola]
MDVPMFQKKLHDINPPLDDDLVQREYGAFGKARELFEAEDAKAAGIVFLDDGTHRFALANGGLLTVYASPYTAFRAGSLSLFAAVARARPSMHCFGHIHEAWGAKRVTWRSEISETPSHFTDINNDESTVIGTLAGLRQSKFDSTDDAAAKEKKRMEYNDVGYCTANSTPKRGTQTLFVNAAIESLIEEEQQWPWMVSIDLPRLVEG